MVVLSEAGERASTPLALVGVLTRDHGLLPAAAGICASCTAVACWSGMTAVSVCEIGAFGRVTVSAFSAPAAAIGVVGAGVASRRVGTGVPSRRAPAGRTGGFGGGPRVGIGGVGCRGAGAGLAVRGVCGVSKRPASS